MNREEFLRAAGFDDQEIAGLGQDADDRGEFRKGLARGWDQTQALGGGLVALGGELVGSDAMKRWGLETYDKNMAEAQESAAAVSDIRDIEGLDTFVDWFVGKAGELAPSVLITLAGGGIGGAIGKQAAKMGVKKFVTSTVEKNLAEGMSKELALKAAQDTLVKQLAKRGTQAGVFAASAGMETGGMAGQDWQETGDISNPLKDLGFGIASGAVELLGAEVGVVEKFLGRAGKEAAEEAIKKGDAHVLKLLGQNVLKTAKEEGGEEALQEVLSIASSVANTGRGLSTDDAWQVANAAAAGATGAPVFGGMSTYGDRVEAARAKEHFDQVGAENEAKAKAIIDSEFAPEREAQNAGRALLQERVPGIDQDTMDLHLPMAKKVFEQERAVRDLEQLHAEQTAMAQGARTPQETRTAFNRLGELERDIVEAKAEAAKARQDFDKAFPIMPSDAVVPATGVNSFAGAARGQMQADAATQKRAGQVGTQNMGGGPNVSRETQQRQNEWAQRRHFDVQMENQAGPNVHAREQEASRIDEAIDLAKTNPAEFIRNFKAMPEEEQIAFMEAVPAPMRETLNRLRLTKTPPELVNPALPVGKSDEREFTTRRELEASKSKQEAEFSQKMERPAPPKEQVKPTPIFDKDTRGEAPEAKPELTREQQIKKLEQQVRLTKHPDRRAALEAQLKELRGTRPEAEGKNVAPLPIPESKLMHGREKVEKTPYFDEVPEESPAQPHGLDKWLNTLTRAKRSMDSAHRNTEYEDQKVRAEFERLSAKQQTAFVEKMQGRIDKAKSEGVDTQAWSKHLEIFKKLQRPVVTKGKASKGLKPEASATPDASVEKRPDSKKVEPPKQAALKEKMKKGKRRKVVEPKAVEPKKEPVKKAVKKEEVSGPSRIELLRAAASKKTSARKSESRKVEVHYDRDFQHHVVNYRGEQRIIFREPEGGGGHIPPRSWGLGTVEYMGVDARYAGDTKAEAIAHAKAAIDAQLDGRGKFSTEEVAEPDLDNAVTGEKDSATSDKTEVKDSVDLSEVRAAFPGQQVIEHNGAAIVRLPFGRRVIVMPDAYIVQDPSDIQGGRRRAGQFLDSKDMEEMGLGTRLDGLALVKLNEYKTGTTIDHEQFHAAVSMAFNRADMQALEGEYGSFSDPEVDPETGMTKGLANEESAARAYEDWKVNGQAQSKQATKLFDKLAKKIGDFLSLLKSPKRRTANDVFTSIKDGTVWRNAPKTYTRKGQQVFSLKKLKHTAEQRVVTHFANGNLDELDPAIAAQNTNPFSKGHIGLRKAKASAEHPFVPVVFAYAPDAKPEMVVKTGRKAHDFVTPVNTYDGVADPLDLMAEAQKTAKEFEASHGKGSVHWENVFCKRLVDLGYDGFSYPAGGGEVWYQFMHPIKDLGQSLELIIPVSDVVEQFLDVPQSLEGMKSWANRSLPQFQERLNEVAKDFPGLVIEKMTPSYAKVDGATSGKMEYSLGLKVRGPVRTARAFAAEAMIANGQRMTFVEQAGTEEKHNGVRDSFKIKDEYDRKYIQQRLDELGIQDYNLAEDGGLWVDTFIHEEMPNDTLARFIDFEKEVRDPKGGPVEFLHRQSDHIGTWSTEEGSYLEARENARAELLKYWGKTKGEEQFIKRSTEGDAHVKRIKEGKYLAEKANSGREDGADSKGEGSAKGIVQKGNGDHHQDAHGNAEVAESFDSYMEANEYRKAHGLLQSHTVKNNGGSYSVVPKGKFSTVSVYDRFEGDNHAQEVLEKSGFKRSESLHDRVVATGDKISKSWRTMLFDKLRPLLDNERVLDVADNIQESAYIAFRMMTSIPEIMGEIFSNGTPTWLNGKVHVASQGQGLTEIIKNLGDEADLWLTELRRVRAEKLIKEVNKDGSLKEKLYSREDLDKMEEMTRPYRDSKAWKDATKQYQKLKEGILKFAIDSGVLSDEQVQAWDHAEYIPFYRIKDDESLFGPKSREDIIDAGIRTLEGGTEALGDPLESILRNWTHLVQQSLRNDATTKALRYMKKLNQATWVEKRVQGKGNHFSILVNGQRHSYRIEDPEMFAVLTNANIPAVENTMLTKVMRGAKRLLTRGATFGLAFRAANFIRDMAHTSVIEKDYSPLDSFRGFMKAWSNDEHMRALRSAGGAFDSGYVNADNPRALADFLRKETGGKKTILPTPVHKVLEFWERIGNAAENAARVQLYAKMVGNGRSELEAAFRSKDLLDFSMSGSSGSVAWLAQVVPFLNARAQGLFKLQREIIGNESGQRHNIVLKGAALMGMTAMLWAMNKDDERWKKLEDYDKFLYYHLFFGDTHIRIPKPFEIGALASSSIEAALDSTVGDDDMSHLADFVTFTLGETFALNPIPQLADPLVQQWANKDSFTKRPIIGYGMDKLDAAEQYDPWTSDFFKAWAKVMPEWMPDLMRSPKRLEKLTNDYFSTLAFAPMAMLDYSTKLAMGYPEDPEWSIDQYVGIGRFVRPKVEKTSKQVTKFYQALADAEKAAATMKAFQKQGRFDEAREWRAEHATEIRDKKRLSKVSRRLSQLNKKMKMVWRQQSLSPAEKRKRIDAILETRNKIIWGAYKRLMD